MVHSVWLPHDHDHTKSGVGSWDSAGPKAAKRPFCFDIYRQKRKDPEKDNKNNYSYCPISIYCLPISLLESNRIESSLGEREPSERGGSERARERGRERDTGTCQVDKQIS